MSGGVTRIMVLYYSRYGSTAALAAQVARGVNSVDGAHAEVRTVAPVSAGTDVARSAVPDAGPRYATHAELKDCDGLIIGSPTRFGNMSAALKYFFDGTGTAWLTGHLAGKPGGVFTSTSSLHGGQESTLLSMALPLLHHGMVLVGIPYSEPALSATRSGGTPYGASHIAWEQDDIELTEHEIACARTLGRRVTAVATRLKT